MALSRNPLPASSFLPIPLLNSVPNWVYIKSLQQHLGQEFLASGELWMKPTYTCHTHVASYQLNVSDAYFTMTCYYDEDSDAPIYVPFSQDQAVVKREHAKRFIKYLKDRQSQVCLPVTKRPDAEYWGTDREAIVIALEVERNLYKHLQELKNLASKNREIDLLEFVKIFLSKQKRNIRYLQYQHSYQEELERLSGRESTPEQFFETWGQEASTSEGCTTSHAPPGPGQSSGTVPISP